MFIRLFFATVFAVCLGGVLSMALDPSLSKRVAEPQVNYGQTINLQAMD